jgi:nicotinic acid mononucleotide adenylyltransferase
LVDNLKTWENYEEMNDRFTFIILSRIGYKINHNNLPKNRIIVQINENDYSSTQIRA